MGPGPTSPAARWILQAAWATTLVWGIMSSPCPLMLAASCLLPGCRLLPRDDRARPCAIAFWLLTVAGLIWVMVALGGATRLTGSGPVHHGVGSLAGTSCCRSARPSGSGSTTCTAPSRNTSCRMPASGWRGSSASSGWNGAHRFWGRLIGLALSRPVPVVLGPRRHPARPDALARAALFPWRHAGRDRLVHGGIRLRGRSHGRLAPSPALHLSMAFLLFGAISGRRSAAAAGSRWWRCPRGQGKVRRQVVAPSGSPRFTMLAGGFVAGIRAGFSYNIPLMDGQIIPAGRSGS